MTYINKPNSFDEVAAWYAKIKPVVSKHHTLEQDVRPIGNRARKWEHIIKVDEHCYALSCGGYPDPVFNWGYTEQLKTHPLKPKDIALCAPIVWRKHKDGSETITVRNGPGEWSHNSTYSFIARALPQDLWFQQSRIGKQFIYNRSSGQTVHLPKTKTVPTHVIEYFTQRAKNGSSVEYYTKRAKGFVPKDDGLSVTFKRCADGKFALVGEAPRVMIHRLRVDKAAKRELKNHIESFYIWVMTMYPLMRTQLNYAFWRSLDKDLADIAKEHGIAGYRPTYGAPFNNSDSHLVQSILKDPDHPMRYGLGVAAMSAIHEAEGTCEEEDEEMRAKYVRARMNRWINAIAGFNIVVKEEK